MPANGRIPRSQLVRIHHPDPNTRCYLPRDAAIAWEDMRQESLRRFGVDLYPVGSASAYRSYEQQQYFYNGWIHHLPNFNLAAYPGTSNHGLGHAVDLATPRMRQIVDQIGAHFGWRKTEAFNEWWHVCYVGGYHRPKDPLRFLNKQERKWLNELLRLRQKNAKRRLTKKEVQRRDHLRKLLIGRRKSIVREAKKTGWNKNNRRQRAHIIWHYTRKRK